MTYKKDMSGIVINTDDSYLKSIKSMRETKAQIDKIEQNFIEFKCELTEIKSLLLKVLNG